MKKKPGQTFGNYAKGGIRHHRVHASVGATAAALSSSAMMWALTTTPVIDLIPYKVRKVLTDATNMASNYLRTYVDASLMAGSVV